MSKPRNDALVVNGGAGDDSIDASSVAAGHVNLTLNGGDGNDLIVGSAGDDLVNGGRGNDTTLMGDGNDTFVWNPGDGSDIVEGQGGFDTMLFNGANVNENIGIFANGTRALFTRDVANITMDLNGVENIQFTARGGSDTINVGDLTGTNVQQVGIDLSGVPGTGVGDGSPDTVIINGTAGNDVITVTDNGNGVITVSGLAEQVTITGFEAANDHLVINGLGGDDVIQGSLLSAGVSLTADGGDGNDVLLGGAGNDTLLGGAGDDVLNGGPGVDVLDGGTGDNVLIQGAGFAAVGSASAATAAFAPVPSLVYSGTAGADTISVTQSGATVNVAGGGAPASFAADGSTLTVSGLAGDDVIDASSMTAPAMRFILDGGDGNDLLHGGQGDDTLLGGAGADTFAFSGSNGSDTIADFQHGLDQIVLQGYGAALSSFADLAGHMAQVGNDVQVNLGAGVAGAGMITLQNTQLAAVTASDFRFS